MNQFKHILLSLIVFLLLQSEGYSQEKFGKTANLGIGIGGYSGYYRYAGSSLPVLSFNYEFDVAKNFTLAPFIGIYRWSNDYYWGDHNNPYRFYTYSETVIPLGVKGTYYFDSAFEAGSKWDFYIAGSLGVAVSRMNWDAGYYGDRNHYHRANAMIFDIHVGTEYHINSKLGLFLDLSSGVSTIGLAFH